MRPAERLAQAWGREPVRMGVVVPAHDEQDLLPGCLAALDAARMRLYAQRPGSVVRLVVVLDSCRDASAQVVLAHDDVEGVRVEARSVGAARAAGCARLLRGVGGVGWIACTDADSRVPEHWLTAQADAQDAGHHLFLGTVLPDPAGLTRVELVRWHALHRLEDGHPHVHGANLGISAQAYRAVGGFRQLTRDEDVDLARRVQDRGLPWTASAGAPVTTSARVVNRVGGGFGGFLRDLGVGTPGTDEAG